MGGCQCRKRVDVGLAGPAYEGGDLQCSKDTESFNVGQFKVSWDNSTKKLSITHLDRPNRILWSNIASRSFLTAGIGEEDVTEKRGFFRIYDKVQGQIARDQVIDAFDFDAEECELKIKGTFSDAENSTWEVRLSKVDDTQLSMKANASLKGTACNRLCFTLQSRLEEQFFGFGAQFTHMHMKGRRVPIISQEPGIGRGIQPLTTVMERFFGAGGKWWNTYAPTPMCLSTDLRGILLENTEYACFDMQLENSMRVGVFSDKLCSRLFCGSTPSGLLKAYTSFCGRMRPLPKWVQNGAIIGMQGGTEKVRKMLEVLEKENVPISGFWLQDWVGRRKTGAGSQLWWNWCVNQELYPGWDQLVADLAQKNIRMLTYINPMVVDASALEMKRDLFAEATKEGYFVKKADGADYPIQNTTFSASLIDLTNPGCRDWIKQVIKDELLGSGASGWMLDYAEALPFDARLHSKEPGSSFHNSYPIEWAKVNREAISEAGKGDDAIFFTRSGYHRSPEYSTCFWLGDQLTSWRQEDGIKSVVIGLVSSGLSGMSINHGDIGGYTSTAILPFRIPFVTFTRNQELLMRWAELSAFTAVFRSHEGNVPKKNHQINDHADTMSHFARFARIYAALADYRAHLCEEAASDGLPVVRHPWLHYPADPEVTNLKLQYLLGSDFMVAPVLDKGSKQVRLYLPTGKWIHLWSGQEVSVEGVHGLWGVCAAPMGYPPVFYTAASAAGKSVAQALTESKDLGESWAKTAFTMDAGQSQCNSLSGDPVFEFDRVGERPRKKALCGGCCARRRTNPNRVLPV